MKKSFFIGLFIAFILLIIANATKTKPQKKIETAVPPVVQSIQPSETSALWLPENGRTIFLNRLLFLEGDIKQRLLKELENELKNYRSTGLDFIKNDIWISYIRKQLKLADIPPDIIYLPVIESSMQPNAVSIKGAVGYWQLMPATALNLGLKITPYVDERRDPVKSTKAAITLLNQLVDKFDDWTATLGGYNMDPAQLIEIRKAEGTTNFYNLRTIPEETQRFPYRILATKLIFENPEKYGFSRKGWLNEDAYDDWQILEIPLIVKSDSYLNTIVEAIMTRFPDFDVSNFRKFNPQILYGFFPEGNYTVYILKNPHGAS